MKKILCALALLSYVAVFGQEREEVALSLKQMMEKDIDVKMRVVVDKSGQINSYKSYIEKKTGQVLDGFYRVEVDEKNYYMGVFYQGRKYQVVEEENEVFLNVVKHYRDGRITKIEIHKDITQEGKMKNFDVIEYDCQRETVGKKQTFDSFLQGLVHESTEQELRDINYGKGAKNVRFRQFLKREFCTEEGEFSIKKI